MARSGCRARSAPREPGEAGGEDEGLGAAPPTAPCRNCRKARVYGSIDPETSHSTTSRRRARAVRRRTIRHGVAAGAVARAQRGADVQPVAPAVAPRSAPACRARRARAPARVISRRSAAARRRRASAKSCRRRSSSALAAAIGDVALRVVAVGALAQAGLRQRAAGRAARAAARRRASRRRSPASAPRSGGAFGSPRGRRGRPCRRRRRRRPRRSGRPGRGAETNDGARRPVEARPGRRGGASGDRAGEPRGALGRRRHAGVVQRARRARRDGGQVDDGAQTSRVPDQPLETALARRLLVLAVLEHRAERAVGRGRVEPRRGRAARSAADPVDRLGDARRLLQVLAAQPAHRRGDVDGERQRAASGTRRRTIATSRSASG